MIDKTNKLWRWKKANKKTKDWYKKRYGLEADEIGTMTNKAWKTYTNLLLKDD